MSWWNTNPNTEYQAIGRRLDDIGKRLTALENQGKQLMSKADDARAVLTKLTADVTQQKTEIASVKQLLVNLGVIIKNLNDKIKNADNIPDDIIAAAQAADDAVNQNTAEIVDAVKAGTPSE